MKKDYLGTRARYQILRAPQIWKRKLILKFVVISELKYDKERIYVRASQSSISIFKLLTKAWVDQWQIQDLADGMYQTW